MANALNLPLPVPVVEGGTGLSSGTATGTLFFNSSTTMASSGALALNQLMLGGGASAPTTLGTSGSTTTVLHGNTAGNPPTFGPVALTADVGATILPTTNGGTNTNGSSYVTNGVVFYNGTSFTTDTTNTFTYNTSSIPTLSLISSSGVELLLQSTGGATAAIFIQSSNPAAGTLINFFSAPNTGWEVGVQGGDTNFTISSVNGGSPVPLVTIDSSSGDVQVNTGNVIIETATRGLEQKSLVVSGGTANGSFNRGVVLVAGTATVNNSYVDTTCVGFASVTSLGGTPGTLRVVCTTAGSYTVTSSSNTDTSTLNVAFIKSF